MRGLTGIARATRNIWLAIGVAMALAMALVSIQSQPASLLGSETLGETPAFRWLFRSLLLWLMFLLLVAYRRWTRIRAQEQRLTALVSSISGEAILTVLPDRTILDSNPVVKELFGYEPDEVVGKKTDVLYSDRRTGETREVFNSLNEIGFHVGKANGRRRSGEAFPIEIMTSPLRGRPGAVVLIRDVTERERAEKAILESRDIAEAANRRAQDALAKLQESYARLKELEQMRDNLTHMIVYDLKAPLSTILAHVAMIKRLVAAVHAPPDEKMRHHLDECNRMVTRMADMISTILDVSRLEHDKMPIRAALYDLMRLTHEAGGLVKPDAALKNITLSLPSQSVSAMCDRDVVCRVIANLLTNSLKYTPRGGHVRIELDKDGDFARISVTDNGSGIPPEFHNRIFQRFSQMDPKEFSTGLGLAFCKMAVERHGGRIGFDTEVGKGTTFWFLLPATGTPAEAAPEKPSSQPSTASVASA